MNVFLSVFVIIIGFNAISIYSEEDTYLDNQDSEEYSSIDLTTVPKNGDEEKLSTDRDDGIVDIDDIIKSSEFNTMFSPETTQVRRFAAPLKDHIGDDVFKPANLNLQSKTAKEEKKSGKVQVKSDKKEYKNESKEDKGGRNGKNNDKSGEVISNEDDNLEKTANGENERTSEIAEDIIAASEIVDRESSRSDETTDAPRTSYVKADKFSDDMDDLIFPYFLDKFKKNYDDETYDRSEYSESQMTLSYDDPTDDPENNAANPARRMFESPSTTNFNDKATDKQETSKENIIPNPVSSTPKPLTGTAMPNNFKTIMAPNIYRPPGPPMPYTNNINPLYPNPRSPQQPRPNIQQLQFRRTNSQNHPIEEFRNFPQNRVNNNWDLNSYPYIGSIPFPLTRNLGSNELNPIIIRKLIEASNNPRNMPSFDTSRIPMHTGNFFRPVDPQFRPQNLNPYLQRYMY